MKKFKIIILFILMLLLLSACNKKGSHIEVSKFMGKSVRSFQRKADIQLKEEVNDVYLLEDNVQVITRKGKISSIMILENGTNYSLYNVKIGMPKSEAEAILKKKFGKETKTLNSAKDLLVYTYSYKGNEFYLIIDIPSDKVIEMAYYKLADIRNTENFDENSNLDNGMLIATVGDDTIYYNEAMVYLKSVQENYEREYGRKIWDSDILGNGKTFGQIIKDEVIKNITEIKIINAKAKELGIALSEEEITTAKEYAKTHYYDMVVEDIDSYLFTEELLEKVYKDNILAEKVFETTTLNIDTNILDIDAKQITVQDLFIKKPQEQDEILPNTNNVNENEGTEELSERDIVYNKVKELEKQAKVAENFYELAEANTEADKIEYTFGRGEAPIEYGMAFEDAAFKLNTDEISGIIETERGWHIIYCVTSYNEDATIQKKESIIEERRNKKFETLYSEWSKNFEVIVNINTWNKISFN